MKEDGEGAELCFEEKRQGARSGPSRLVRTSTSWRGSRLNWLPGTKKYLDGQAKKRACDIMPMCERLSVVAANQGWAFLELMSGHKEK